MACSKAVPPQFQKAGELLERARSSAHGIVAHYELFVVEALKVGLAYERVWRIEHCIVHRKNRDGLICTGSRVHEILDKIDRTGVSLSQVRDATSMEGAEDRINEKYFILKVDGDPTLPRYIVGSGQTASLACSHFVQALKAIEEGMVPYIFIRGRTPAWGTDHPHE